MADARPIIYVETTIVSYLTAWPSRDLVRAAQQQITRDWWNHRRTPYDLVASALVVQEAGQGDPSAAEKRLAVLKDIPLLDITPEADTLANALLDELAIPRGEDRDAAHVAIAATNGVDILLTWNCRHLANLRQRGIIEAVCREHGYRPPMIGTPNELEEAS
jgi:hypothetical protein